VLPEWPIEGDLVIPAEQMPESAKKGMGERAIDVERLRKANGLEP
jgi:ribonuclease Z